MAELESDTMLSVLRRRTLKMVLGAAIAFLSHPGSTGAFEQGKDRSADQLEGAELLKALDFLSAKLQSNYAQIETWQGDYALTDKFYQISKRAAQVSERVTSIDRLADGRPYWRIEKVRVAFAIDTKNNMLRCDYTPIEQPRFVDVASGTQYKFDAKRYGYQQIVTPEHWLRFPVNERIGQVEGFPPLQHIDRNNGGRILYRNEPRRSQSEKFLGHLIDPREFFGNSSHLYFTLCDLYANSLRGDRTEGELQHAKENLVMHRNVGVDGSIRYQMRIYYRGGPKQDVMYYIDTVFDSSVEFNVTSDTRTSAEGKPRGTRTWTYKDHKGILLPTEYSFQHYDKVNRLQGAPFAIRRFVLEDSIVNGRSPISIAIGGRLFLEENFSGSPKAEACAGAVVE